MNIFEMFAEYEIKQMAAKVLTPYVNKGEINAAQQIVMEQACVDFLQLVAAEMLAKQEAGS